MLTFKQSIELLDEDENISILLGNGFSQAWDSDIFNYANLLEGADFDDREHILRPLFAKIDTYDFEIIMKQLVSAIKVLEVYETDEELIRNIADDKAILKDALIKAISTTHPDSSGSVSVEEYKFVRKFLSIFKEVYTLNYDLLFYWARNQTDIGDSYSTDDGFRGGQLWEGYDTNQNVYFLHGALHIYDDGTNIKKHTYDNGITIIEQVRHNLDCGNFPLFVSEPTHIKKKHKIEHNPYLSYCYRALGQLKNVLFIYGHSFDENDKHIFDQIKKSKVKKIFVSIFGDENSDANTRTKANALAYLGGSRTKVEFYQAESTQIWEELDV